MLSAIRSAGQTGIDFMGIRAALTRDANQSDEQHRAGISNALTRLRLKGQAKSIENGRWVSV